MLPQETLRRVRIRMKHLLQSCSFKFCYTDFRKKGCHLNQTAKRLATALLGYIILVIFLLTWNPFSFALPEHLQFSFHVGRRDALANVLLFLPVGFLYRLGQGRPRNAILLGATISAVIETGQFFIPGRSPSAVDIAMNTFGSALGAGLYDLLTARIVMTPRMVGQLGLEIPLMGLLYLLVPLLWVNRLVPGDALTRWLITFPIGVCGAVVLGDVFQQWWGQVSLRSHWRAGLAAGIWFLVGIGPSLPSHLPAWSASLTGIAILAAALAGIPEPSNNRRFERATLNRLIPGFVLYVVLQALWPFSQLSDTWHGSLGLMDARAHEDIRVNIRLIEHLAAFTVLGYISAEWHGRAEVSWRHDFPRLLLVGIVSALTLEILVGFQAGPGANLLRLIIAICGALFGGAIYHLQRDHVRSLLGRSTADQK
ncbi:MAG TPA: VanZ family protein [Anaerolineales bacterium]